MHFLHYSLLIMVADAAPDTLVVTRAAMSTPIVNCSSSLFLIRVLETCLVPSRSGAKTLLIDHSAFC